MFWVAFILQLHKGIWCLSTFAGHGQDSCIETEKSDWPGRKLECLECHPSAWENIQFLDLKFLKYEVLM